MTRAFAPSGEHSRLAELYAISTLFTAFETVEKTLGAAIGIISRTLPLHSASMIESVIGARANLTVWPANQATADRIETARAHVVDAYTYLAGGQAEELDVRESMITNTLPERRIQRGASPHRFIVIPLLVGRGPVFGAFQIEGALPLDLSDLVFVNTVANQLAIALDRHRTLSYEVLRRAEAQESRAKFEALLDNLDCAFVWEADAHTRRISYVSGQVERLLGYPRQQWLDELDFWGLHVHPGDRDRVMRTFERALLERRGKRCDHRCLTADGQTRWLHTTLHVVDADANRPSLQGVSLDITSSKLAEERVREQLAFTNAMAASLGEGTIAVDLEGKITFINPAAESLLQCTRTEAVGTPSDDIVHLEASDGTAVECPLATAIRTGDWVRSDDHVLVRPDGLRFPVSYTATPILRSSVVTGAVIAFDDISDRKRDQQTEHFLVEANEVLGTSLESAAVLTALARVGVPTIGQLCYVDVLGADDRLMRCAWAHRDPESQAALDRVFDALPPISFLVEPVARVVTAGHSLLAATIDDAWIDAAATSSDEQTIMRNLGLHSALVVPLTIGKRKVGALTFYRQGGAPKLTETDQSLAEELARRGALSIEHARLYGQAQAAIAAREHMLAIVSHDLRAPLSTILLATDLLQESEPSAVVEKIDRAANRMNRMIGDLLDFASIAGGRIAMLPNAHDVAAIVEETVIGFEELAKKHQLTLVAEVAAGMPLAFCDRDRMLQVIGNLVANAIKVTQPGGSVSVHVEPRECEVLVAVCDTGPGIPLADQARLFERYWRSPGASYKGIGLGLAIAQGIITAHGGRIWVDSEVGHGATFYFTIPVVPIAVLAEVDPSPVVPASRNVWFDDHGHG
jgi:PAS domain S-box-containing protein